MNSSSAISWLLRPVATAWTIWVSRAVRGCAGLGPGSAVGEVAQQPWRDRRRDERVAGVRGPYGLDPQAGAGVIGAGRWGRWRGRSSRSRGGGRWPGCR
ncbi:hypothetical protein ACWEPC_06850, partial [Nonomuraea sp. NPDC004297]